MLGSTTPQYRFYDVTYPMNNVVEDGHHVAHVGDREDRVKDLALLPMLVPCGTNEMGAISTDIRAKVIPFVASNPGPKARCVKLSA